MNPVNNRIEVRDGTINAQAIAMGNRSTAIVTTTAAELARRGQPEVAEALAELERALTEHAGQLSDGDQVLAATQTLAGEMAAEQPNKVTLNGILAGIASSVGSVAVLAEAVQRLHDVITRM